jgi:hypothetical protein
MRQYLASLEHAHPGEPIEDTLVRVALIFTVNRDRRERKRFARRLRRAIVHRQERSLGW